MMKIDSIRTYPLQLVFFILGFGLSACEAPDPSQQNSIVEAPIDFLLQQRLYPYGKIDKKAFQKALKEKNNLSLRSSNSDYNQDWELRGPVKVGGRVTDIEMPEGSMNTIYVGSASGGIFKSTDQGKTFKPIFDEALSLSIGDLAIHKLDTNLIYVGTGEANAGGGSLTYDGLGMYKSLDGGDNWQHLGLEDAGSIGKVTLSHQNPNLVYVAAMGDLFANTGNRGVFKTEDGGQNWEKLLFVSDSTGFIDLALHPENDQILYAAAWERIRRPSYRQYGGSTSGVYKSIDGGKNWIRLENGLPQLPEEKGRIGLAIAPSNPEVVYAYVMDAIGYIQGIYRSQDGGASWEDRSASGITSVSFGWWFGKITVDPLDEDLIYLTSLHMYRSENGGQNWRRIFNNAHVDHHALFVNTVDNNFVINGNDGGVYLSYDKGINSTKVEELPNNQFYNVRIDPNNSLQLFGGMQDNGTYRTVNGVADEWDFLFGGDGFGIQVEPGNSDVFYVQFQWGNLFRTLNNGLSYQQISIDGVNNWNTPLRIDPINPAILYSGNQRVYQSNDRGNFWFPISPPLTSRDPEEGNLPFGTLTSLDISPIDNAVIYAGTDDGQVWVTKDQGENWTNISRGLPNRWITSICADPNNLNRVYISVSGYRFGEASAQVFLSEDYGQAWEAIGNGLPDVPVNDIIADPMAENRLFIGTDIGVFYSLDRGETWTLLGQRLPNVPITDLDLAPTEGLLVAATYGRSMYSYLLPSFVSNTNSQLEQSSIEVFPNPVVNTLNIKVKPEIISEYELFNTKGQLLFREQLTKGAKEISVTSLKNGLYIIRLRLRNGKILSKKFMVLK